MATDFFTIDPGVSSMKKVMKRIDKAIKNANEYALEKTAIDMLNWFNNGSPNEPATPPIRHGVLRGSSSAFVGNKLVGVNPEKITPGGNEKQTPNKSVSGSNAQRIRLGWNTDYATRMHEETYNLGPISAATGTSGPKWAEKHINADGALIAETIGKFMEQKL